MAYCGEGEEELMGQQQKTDGGRVDGTEGCGQIMGGLHARLRNTSSFPESKQEPL